MKRLDLKCPTCGHRHPDGLGISFCLCEDCFLLSGPTPFESMTPEYQTHYRVLVARAEALEGR